jgi:hypothetical protein
MNEAIKKWKALIAWFMFGAMSAGLGTVNDFVLVEKVFYWIALSGVLAFCLIPLFRPNADGKEDNTYPHGDKRSIS